MMKRKRFPLIPTWLRRRPKVTYVVCPNCQRQAINDPGQLEVDQAHQMVAGQAFDAVAGVDALRRQKAAGDPIRNRMLADIEAGFIQNVADVGRKLRRAPRWEDRS
jgi:hypothetical protein